MARGPLVATTQFTARPLDGISRAFISLNHAPFAQHSHEPANKTRISLPKIPKNKSSIFNFNFKESFIKISKCQIWIFLLDYLKLWIFRVEGNVGKEARQELPPAGGGRMTSGGRRSQHGPKGERGGALRFPILRRCNDVKRVTRYPPRLANGRLLVNSNN